MDEQTRELERRWHETGNVEDGAAFLRQRLRSGELPRERLELASKLGHPSARVFTPLPIQDRTDDEMRAIAYAAVADLIAKLVGPQD